LSHRTAPTPPPARAEAPAPTFDAATVATLVAATLGRDVLDAAFVPKGFANENWRVRTTEGDVLVKIGGPGADPAKWRASARALGFARDAGVPGPALLHGEASCRELAGRVLRIQSWIDGVSPDVLDGASAERFWTALGRAVRSLHGIAFDAFSSRLDDSAPDFPTWSAYLDYRIPQIEARCARASLLGAVERAEIWARVRADAQAVDSAVTPAFAHRDLHTDNLLATEDGGLAALLDFDMVEPWDPVGDWFKLSHWCFAGRPERRQAFEAGYGVPSDCWTAFERRRAIVDVLEGMNLAANDSLAEDARGVDWTLAIVDGALAQ
jgi:aminoglycoside phosphotransferase (APT) family kinase protein